MYNIYIEEKNQRQAKELEKEKLRRLNYTQRYKSILNRILYIAISLIIYRRSIIIDI